MAGICNDVFPIGGFTGLPEAGTSSNETSVCLNDEFFGVVGVLQDWGGDEEFLDLLECFLLGFFPNEGGTFREEFSEGG